MATTERLPAPRVGPTPSPNGASPRHAPVDPKGILGHLFREGHRFEFFQAIWLLETLLGEAAPGKAGLAQRERIQIRPHTARVFPATDVRQVTWTEEEVARITVTFMGLYGIDSPLPASFYEAITMEADDGEVLRDFLDIFNHRLYAYFYRSWKKYRPGLHFNTTHQNNHAETFLNLAGLGAPDALASINASPLQLAAFAGRLGNPIRNAEGLQALLAGLLEDVSVRVMENVPRWVLITERAGLGKESRLSASLGVNTMVGRHLFDVSGKFRLVLGPLTLQQYQTYLPGEAQAQALHALVRLYTPDFLDYDVELLLETDEVRSLTLGGRNAQLGRDAWVGRPAKTIVSEVVAYA